MSMKKKTKAAEIWNGIGIALSVVYLMPVMLWEKVSDLLNKKNQKEEPKPEPIKFVCSECGETFTAKNEEQEIHEHGKEGYSYSKPTECPKCHGWKTRPEDSDLGLYERIWDMNELWSFVRDMRQDWDYRQSTLDMRWIDYQCTECNTIFKARGIGSSSSWYPFPSRCPNCHHMRTLPADEKNHKVYEPLWTMLELADRTKAIRKTKKVLNGFLGLSNCHAVTRHGGQNMSYTEIG